MYETDTNDVYVENAVVRDIHLIAIMVNAASLASTNIGRLAGQGTPVLNWWHKNYYKKFSLIMFDVQTSVYELFQSVVEGNSFESSIHRSTNIFK